MAIYLRAKGRTSSPAKTIGHRESINPTLAVLKLVAKYVVTTIYSNMQQKERATNAGCSLATTEVICSHAAIDTSSSRTAT